MKEILHRLMARLNINGRDLPVFLLSLLLAFSIWLIHTLSFNYTDYISVPVVASANIRGHAAVSANRCDVVARCRTTGYNIVKASLSGKKPVTVQFSRMRHKDGEIFYLTAADLQEYTHLIYGENAVLDYYVSDTLFFRFPYEDYKKVPVYPVNQLDFASQYTMSGTVEVEPDSVYVYGEPHVLGNIEYAFTEPIKLFGLDSDASGVVRLENIRGIRLSEESVRYSIEVTRFLEVSMRFPVDARNVPADKQMMIYPSTVEVVMRCVYPNVRNITEEVSFYVDYDDFHTSRSGKCLVRADVRSDNVISCRIVPQVVECVLSDR